MPKRDNRCVLHRNKLDAFREWVKTQGYIVLEGTSHPYEVLQIRKFDPSGNTPDLFFYQKVKYQHVTIPHGTESLVREFIKATKVGRASLDTI